MNSETRAPVKNMKKIPLARNSGQVPSNMQPKKVNKNVAFKKVQKNIAQPQFIGSYDDDDYDEQYEQIETINDDNYDNLDNSFTVSTNSLDKKQQKQMTELQSSFENLNDLSPPLTPKKPNVQVTSSLPLKKQNVPAPSYAPPQRPQAQPQSITLKKLDVQASPNVQATSSLPPSFAPPKRPKDQAQPPSISLKKLDVQTSPNVPTPPTILPKKPSDNMFTFLTPQQNTYEPYSSQQQNVYESLSPQQNVYEPYSSPPQSPKKSDAHVPLSSPRSSSNTRPAFQHKSSFINDNENELDSEKIIKLLQHMIESTNEGKFNGIMGNFNINIEWSPLNKPKQFYKKQNNKKCRNNPCTKPNCTFIHDNENNN